uniref:Arginase n=1 Tax=Glossina brevipalpis TaxID=37001 RepID=A0A1A9WRQ6_9MUSC
MFKNSANTIMRNYAASRTNTSKRLGILGVPFSKGQGKKGVDLAPDFLRDNGLLRMLSKCNVNISDYGNLKYESHITREDRPPNPYKKIKNYAEFMACNKALIPRISEILNENDMFLILGGDHSIGFGRCLYAYKIM